MWTPRWAPHRDGDVKPGRVGSEVLSGRGAEDTLVRHLLNTALI